VSDCLFCGIVSGAVPSTEVLSSPSSYAFRDLNPAAPVHVLVVPRRHIVDAAALGSEHGADLADLFATAAAVAAQEGLAERGYRLVFNVGRDSGNTVSHLHLHVLGGRGLGWPPG
jgi:histidine triad (HIT) family protein